MDDSYDKRAKASEEAALPAKVNQAYLDHSLLAEDLAAAKAYAAERHSDSTLRAYRNSVRGYLTWCGRRGLSGFPLEDVQLAAFLSAEADRGRKPATLALRVAALRNAVKERGEDIPDLRISRQVLQGIRRVKDVKQRQARPITPALLRDMCEGLDLTTLSGLRDKALLLIGFTAALRRSEVAAIRFEDLEFVEDKGLLLTLAQSKTDQEGKGQTLAIPQSKDPALCPVTALRAWLDKADIDEGPVFCRIFKPPSNAFRQPLILPEYIGDKAITPTSVANIIKRHVAEAGEDPAAYSGHSLRAGFATSAARAGKPLHQIKSQTRHLNDRDVQRYIRLAQMFDDHVLDGIL